MMYSPLWALLRVVGLATGIGFPVASVQAQSMGTWAQGAPLPAPLTEVAVVQANGTIHVLGGNVLSFTGPYHQEYDPARDQWRARSPLPRSLDHIGTALLNGKIYAVGGFVGGGVHRDGQNTAFEYDPSLDTWRILAPLTAGRGSIAVVSLDGKIHAIGGRDPDGKTVATHDVYDPTTNTWTEAAPLPKARDHMAAAVIDGKIHVVGGRFASPLERTDMHDVYDPKTDTWTPAPPLPTPRSGLAGILYKGLFLVLGGELPPDYTFPNNEAYDPKTNTWRVLAPMPVGRHGTGAATNGDHVYLAGGSLKPGGRSVTDQLIVFTLP
jgi:N-acetylneuraminic acid mutarotase